MGSPKPYGLVRFQGLPIHAVRVRSFAEVLEVRRLVQLQSLTKWSVACLPGHSTGNFRGLSPVLVVTARGAFFFGSVV